MEWLDSALQNLLASPATFACIVGIVAQVFGTQRLKFLLPPYWGDYKRKVAILLLSLALTSSTWLVYVGTTWAAEGFSWAPLWTGFWLWFIVWLTGTALYEAWVATLPKAQQKAFSARVEAAQRRKSSSLPEEQQPAEELT